MRKLGILIVWLIGGSLIVAALSENASAHSGSGSFTTFSSGSVLTASALNGNFSHLHDTFSAGITDANVSTVAAIKHSKLSQPNLIPKAVGVVTTVCNGGTSAICSLYNLGNVTQIRGAGVNGEYHVTLNYTPTSTVFPVIITPMGVTNSTCVPVNSSTSAPHVHIVCVTAPAATPLNTAFSIAVYGG